MQRSIYSPWLLLFIRYPFCLPQHHASLHCLEIEFIPVAQFKYSTWGFLIQCPLLRVLSWSSRVYLWRRICTTRYRDSNTYPGGTPCAAPLMLCPYIVQIWQPIFYSSKQRKITHDGSVKLRSGTKRWHLVLFTGRLSKSSDFCNLLLLKKTPHPFPWFTLLGLDDDDAMPKNEATSISSSVFANASLAAILTRRDGVAFSRNNNNNLFTCVSVVCVDIPWPSTFHIHPRALISNYDRLL